MKDSIDRGTDRATPSVARAFTLVELLVVIGIIALLISILLPTMSKARRSANDVKCRSNLKQIALASRMYANDNDDHYPDGYTIGGSRFRVAPGTKNAADPNAEVEIFGLHSIFRQAGYLKSNEVWVCPSAPDYMKDFGNTYNWMVLGGRDLDDVKKATGANQAKWTSLIRGRERNKGVEWVADNIAWRPFASGVRASSADASIPPAQQVRPHNYPATKLPNRLPGTRNTLYMSGAVGVTIDAKKNDGSGDIITKVILDP
jgi:prepilin-type N-terminal cleavage/methylation domain-containing protein